MQKWLLGLILLPLIATAQPSYTVGQEVEVQPTMTSPPYSGPWVRGRIIKVESGLIQVEDPKGNRYYINTQRGNWVRSPGTPASNPAPANPPAPTTANPEQGQPSSDHSFRVGDRVEVDKFHSGRWETGTVVSQDSYGFYTVEMDSANRSDRVKIGPNYIRAAGAGDKGPPVKGQFPANAVKASPVNHEQCTLTREHMLAKFKESEADSYLNHQGYQDVRFVFTDFTIVGPHAYRGGGADGINAVPTTKVIARFKAYCQKTSYDGQKTMTVFTYDTDLFFHLRAGKCAYFQQRTSPVKTEYF